MALKLSNTLIKVLVVVSSRTDPDVDVDDVNSSSALDLVEMIK